MINKLFLCVILLNLTLNAYGASEVENYESDEGIMTESYDGIMAESDEGIMAESDEGIMGKIERRSFFESFGNFFSGVKNFFRVKTDDLVEKKNRVKSAFEIFFKELNKPKVAIPPGGKTQTQNGPKLSNDTWRRYFKVRPETSVQQMITSHGYNSEAHTVLTADGYMLSMQRIIPDSNKNSQKVVLLHHGILGSAEDWLLLGRQRALPYLLSDNGFDVWLLNARGNRYSRIHTNKNKNMYEFWDFSWHEMGVYDLPAVIQHVSEITHNADIHFIGYSMGATALFALLTTAPEYNFILKSGILLAPLAFMYHVKGPFGALADFYRRNGQNSLNFLGQSDFLPEGSLPDQIIQKYCKGDENLCFNPLLLLADGGKEIPEPQLYNNILDHVPAGGSTKTIIHYVQLVKNGYFEMFDYGTVNNIIKYGNSTPPTYNLRQITLPIAMFSSPSDWLATGSDIQTLLSLLQNVYVHHVVKAKDFGHLDFIWSPDAPQFVFDFVLNVLHELLPSDDQLAEV